MSCIQEPQEFSGAIFPLVLSSPDSCEKALDDFYWGPFVAVAVLVWWAVQEEERGLTFE